MTRTKDHEADLLLLREVVRHRDQLQRELQSARQELVTASEAMAHVLACEATLQERLARMGLS